MSSSKSTRKFKTEVSQLLELITHSLYSHKEIFLRELISNSSDAIDRLRFKATTDHGLLEGDEDFAIRITGDQESKTLVVEDNGIGMDRDEVISNIGTIAKSGTAEFAEAVRSAKEAGDISPELIGKFGVGFYSAFMVAEKITLTTRCPHGQGIRWTSDGQGSYTIEEVEIEKRGTRIEMQLREPEEGDEDFTLPYVLRSTVKKHSDFVAYPVMVLDGSENESEPVNSMKALWARPKNEVDEEEYVEFYKHISHDWAEPLAHLHLKLEGLTECDALLYLPSVAPQDLYWPERKSGLHLYCRRVFITDDCADILPPYLRFVQGVVDAADLNLNVSREILQEDRMVRNIRKNLVRRLLDMFGSLDEEKFAKFFGQMGNVLKEGVHTDPENREKIAALLTYPTADSPGEPISLKTYVERMATDQEAIYYLTGDNLDAMAENPHLEKLADKGYQVLLMSEPVDEFVVGALDEFQGKNLVSVESGDLGLSDETKVEEEKEEFSDLLSALASALEEEVKEVRPTSMLTDSAACLSTDEDASTQLMQKVLKAAGKGLPDAKRVLEVNLSHPLLVKLEELRSNGDSVDEWAMLVYELALVAEGGAIKHPAAFSRRMGELAAKAI